MIVSFKFKYKADTEGSQCSEKQEVEATACLPVAVAGMCVYVCARGVCLHVDLCTFVHVSLRVHLCVGSHVSVCLSVCVSCAVCLCVHAELPFCLFP